MRCINWKTVSTLVTMAMVASACSETVVAPSAESPSAPASMALAPEGRPSLSLAGGAALNTATDFTVGAMGGVFRVGNNAVVFPANSICDPATSGYGAGTWDSSCAPLQGTITVHAVTRVHHGRTQVDFTPNLRFAPSDSPAEWVWLYMYTPSAAAATNLSQFNILYAPTLDGALVDESLVDASLRTYVDSRSGVSVRRVKHFSGYTVSTGAKCDPTVTTCPAPTP